MPVRRLDPDLAPLPPERVRAWREGLGLTQVDAARLLGLSRARYLDYERGQRTTHDVHPVVVPRVVRLAMAAVAASLGPAG